MTDTWSSKFPCGTCIFAAFLIYFVVQIVIFIYRNLVSPLCSVLGPFFARFGRLYFVCVSLGRWARHDIALHREYGPMVRVGVDLFSFDSPGVTKKVYGAGSKFAKSDWYDAQMHPDPSRSALFPDQDIPRYAETRKRFQAMYSLSSLVNYEPLVDECGYLFERRLEEFASKAAVFGMSQWFQYYAFDNVFGIGGAAARNYIMHYVQSRISQRRIDRKSGVRPQDDPSQENAPIDFFDKLMIANEKDPEKVTPSHIFMMRLANIIAGSDTTPISLSGLLYNLLKYPQTLQRLQREISAFELQGRIADRTRHIMFKQSQEMPHLQGVMKEVFRIHFAIGLILWRVVLEGGVEIGGYFFPADSTIGLNSWCAHYNKGIWGEDIELFRPESWINAQNEDGGHRLRKMEAYYLPFGLGSRTCIGRWIRFLEMSKLIPELVRRFDFELLHGGRERITENNLFVKPKDFKVKLTLRLTDL